MISSLDIRSACARVLDAEQKWVGSSFLVSSRHALTAAHVVERLNTGPIVLEFSVGRYNAKVEVLDKGIDCAVLSLDRAVDDVQPLGLGVNVTAGDTGRFFGFSQNLGGAGILIDGRVQDIILNPLWSVGEKAPRPTILLFPSHHLSKRTVIGFSGAPLVVGNLAVGILRELREGETGSTEFLLFTRIQDALELLPKEVAGRILPRPPTEQSRERRGKDAIVVVTALDEELDYLYEESSLHWSDLKVNQDGLSYRQGHLGDADIIAASARSMGSIATAILTTKALKEWQPTVAAMIGICAGRKEKGVNIGDVIMAAQCFHYQFGSFENGKIRRELRVENIETQIIDIAEHLSRRTRVVPDIQASVSRGFKRPNTVLQCHVGPMASADLVVKDVEKFGEAIEADRKTIAVDMESYAFLRAARLRRARWSFVVKSVSDFADSEKSDEFREYAKYTAARFFLHVAQSLVAGWT